VSSYLDDIVSFHRRRSQLDRRPLGELLDRASACPPARGFAAALASMPGVSLIAEIKRRSPSRGDLAPRLDPAALAGAYEAGGAACLSVLTDSEFFGGSPADLQAARSAVRLPVLRKDFTVCPADVCDARLMGADAVLLIAAALAASELSELGSLASDLGIDALVEVHDEGELDTALEAGAAMVGVNQRDLSSFEVDPCCAARLSGRVPPGVLKVAESGVSGAEQVERLADAGYDAVLVGEHLVVSGDPEAAARSLCVSGSGEASSRTARGG
jgi:indole-3-glycerol phosphate synthase